MSENKNHSELIATDSKDGVELICKVVKFLPCPFTYENEYIRTELYYNKRFYAIYFRLIESVPDWVATKIYADIKNVLNLDPKQCN